MTLMLVDKTIEMIRSNSEQLKRGPELSNPEDLMAYIDALKQQERMKSFAIMWLWKEREDRIAKRNS